MLLPEVFTKIGVINVPEWYDAGKQEYFASSSTLFRHRVHPVPLRVESGGGRDIKNPAASTRTPSSRATASPPTRSATPAASSTPSLRPTLEAKEKEIANGRLAMLAFLGFVIQHNITGKGPFENLLQHLSDPWHNTIIQTLSS
ncbi:unnamed protein product [Spirodela intermedia]|uniref:Chlorophyll a-b binding protein, chloroplastic n=1 Tax=Spirodela intermedia TaxID=51605 RepID=A0A7I8J2T1_SPIIN|nr:unnamed protein product [Spirodela intermedia]CAA6664536.1 unnamed protein product [Spirodela intermedia]